MRKRKLLFAGSLVLASAGFIVLSLVYGQEQFPPAQSTGPSSQDPSAAPTNARRPARDFRNLPGLQKQMFLSLEQGSDWLRRANRADGRFVYGLLPDLKSALDGDNYLRQVGAAYALARAASLLGEERYAAVARQAILTSLLDTTIDPKDPQARYTTLPMMAVNRLGAAAILVLAINELPAPSDDLLEQSEQLCRYIRKQQGADGSLDYAEGEAKTDLDPDAINYYPGQALLAVIRSQRHRPAAWKIDLVRKALPYYQAWWRAHQNMAAVACQSGAYTEAFLLTKEKPFADSVFEMNDWICALQYTQLDPRHPMWSGGFMEWTDGRAVSAVAQVGSAVFAEGLANACRLAFESGDKTRCERYRGAVERCLQFVSTLQYTDANTQHFADWYRPLLIGGFHASHQDGTLRIDYTEHAVGALVQYLTLPELTR